MSTGYLPEAITKDVLFKRAQERFQDWARMYGDPNVSATYMYEDMSASCYCGAPKDDFPEAFKTEPKKISDNEFKYRDIVFRVTHDYIDDKSYIWCGHFEVTDELVYWVWGAIFVGAQLVISTDELDKFINSHKEEDK